MTKPKGCFQNGRRGRIGKLRRRCSRIVKIICAEKHLLFGVNVKIQTQNVRIVFDFIVGVKAESGGIQAVADFKTVRRITRRGIGKNRQREWITAVCQRKNRRDLQAVERSRLSGRGAKTNDALLLNLVKAQRAKPLCRESCARLRSCKKRRRGFSKWVRRLRRRKYFGQISDARLRRDY